MGWMGMPNVKPLKPESDTVIIYSITANKSQLTYLCYIASGLFSPHTHQSSKSHRKLNCVKLAPQSVKQFYLTTDVSRRKDRPRTAWMNNVKDWTGLTLSRHCILQITEQLSVMQPTLRSCKTRSKQGKKFIDMQTAHWIYGWVYQPVVAFCAGPQTSGRWRTQNETLTARTLSMTSCNLTEPVSRVSQCRWLVHERLSDSKRTCRQTSLLLSGGWNVTVSVSALYCTSLGVSSVSTKHTDTHTHYNYSKLFKIKVTISCSSKSRLILPSWFYLSSAGLPTRVVPDKIQDGHETVLCACVSACVRACVCL